VRRPTVPTTIVSCSDVDRHQDHFSAEPLGWMNADATTDSAIRRRICGHGDRRRG
jgi:hypothetical protein